MRINQFVAKATGFSRRHADFLIESGHITVNNQIAKLGLNVAEGDDVRLNDQRLKLKTNMVIMLHKPTGYVCSRRHQGSRTIYELLPKSMSGLFSIGRLDKDSSGLLLLTNDGRLAQAMSHPKFQKVKTYEVLLDNDLSKDAFQILLSGVVLEDGLSRFMSVSKEAGRIKIEMAEGRNRQIRRTFEALGYKVKALHRTGFGAHNLGNLPSGRYKQVV